MLINEFIGLLANAIPFASGKVFGLSDDTEEWFGLPTSNCSLGYYTWRQETNFNGKNKILRYGLEIETNVSVIPNSCFQNPPSDLSIFPAQWPELGTKRRLLYEGACANPEKVVAYLRYPCWNFEEYCQVIFINVCDGSCNLYYNRFITRSNLLVHISSGPTHKCKISQKEMLEHGNTCIEKYSMNDPLSGNVIISPMQALAELRKERM